MQSRVFLLFGVCFTLCCVACGPADQQPSDIDGDATLHCGADQCYIDGRCVAAGTESVDYDCLYCDPKRNPNGWSRYQSHHMRICRSSEGECNPAEFCQGETDDCPVDKHAADDTPCGTNTICDGLSTCHNGQCEPTTEPLECPGNLTCAPFTQTCICPHNYSGDNCDQCARGYAGDNCESCAPGYFGEGCVECPDGYTGENCSECIGHYEGEDCSYCPEPYTGDNCDQCPWGYTGELCEECADTHYHWEGSRECTRCPDCGVHGQVSCGEGGDGTCTCDPRWAKPYCSHCIVNFSGENCEQCAEGYTGSDCADCAEGFYYFSALGICRPCIDCGEHGSSTCGGDSRGTCICEPNWGGNDCSHCIENFTGPNCDQCAPGHEGPDCTTCSEGYHRVPETTYCTSCPDCGEHGEPYCIDGEYAHCTCDTGWDGFRCDRCAEYFTGDNCDTCEGNRIGQNCESCPVGFTGELCTRCIAGLAGESCDHCSENYTGEQCDQCAPGFEGPHCLPSPTCVHGAIQNNRCVCDPGWFGSRCDHDTIAMGACVALRGACTAHSDCCLHNYCAKKTGEHTGTCQLSGRAGQNFYGISLSPDGRYVVVEHYLDELPTVSFLDIDSLELKHTIRLSSVTGEFDINLQEDLLLENETEHIAVSRLSTGQSLALIPRPGSGARFSSTGRYIAYTYSKSRPWQMYDLQDGAFIALPGSQVYDDSFGNIARSTYFDAVDSILAQAYLSLVTIGIPSRVGTTYYTVVDSARLTLTDIESLSEYVVPGTWEDFAGATLSPDGSIIAVKKTDEIVAVLPDGTVTGRYPGRTASFGPGNKLATGDDRGNVKIYEPGASSASVQFTATIPLWISKLWFTPDGEKIVIDNRLGMEVFDANTGIRNAVYPNADTFKTTLFAKNADFFVIQQSGMYAFRAPDAVHMGPIGPENTSITAIALSDNGHVAASSHFSTAKLYNVATNTLRCVHENPDGSYLDTLKLSPDGSLLVTVTGRNDNILNFVNTTTCEISSEVILQDSIENMEFTADGSKLVVAEERLITIIDMTQPVPAISSSCMCDQYHYQIGRIAPNHDASVIYYPFIDDLYSIRVPDCVVNRETIPSPGTYIRAISFDATDSILAVLLGNNKVQLVNMTDGQMFAELDTPTRLIRITLSLDGKTLFGARENGEAIVWDISSLLPTE